MLQWRGRGMMARERERDWGGGGGARDLVGAAGGFRPTPVIHSCGSSWKNFQASGGRVGWALRSATDAGLRRETFERRWVGVQSRKPALTGDLAVALSVGPCDFRELSVRY